MSAPRFTVSAEASIFFTKHGWVELEIPHEELMIQGKDDVGRDLWRTTPALQQFLTRKLSHIALTLTGKKKLLLGCDQWFKAGHLPKQAGPLKEFISVQGLALGVAISANPSQTARRSGLGIVPVPTTAERILFFRPDVILDWPHATSEVYLAVYVLPTAVYVHNGKDPFTNSLKKFGYNFGDVLKNEFHPMIMTQ